MAYINNYVLDNGLVTCSGSKTLHICTSEPSSFSEIATKTLGNKTVTVGSPENRAISGRLVVVPAIVSASPGAVTASGDATVWALTDGTRVIATQSLSDVKRVALGDTFTLQSLTIELQGI